MLKKYFVKRYYLPVLIGLLVTGLLIGYWFLPIKGQIVILTDSTNLNATGPAAGETPQLITPTKLGVVFADPERDWHGKSGWTVELVYTNQPNDPDFSFEPLVKRVEQANQHRLRTLVRIAYDRGQAIPPVDDPLALKAYLDYCARLANDPRLSKVYGYIIGSGFNRKSENSISTTELTTPEGYARIFSGYGLPPSRSDNVLQVMHAANPQIRVLVGPVTPWVDDQSGQVEDSTNAPWLNYMTTLVARLDEASKAKQAAGIALAGPDGFAVQAPGRPEAPEVADQPAHEPATDIYYTRWGKAQMGFRVYRDWLRIINQYQTTQNLPVYINSANTFTPDTQIDPEQNYPAGWLVTALDEVNRQSQIQALCWYVDLPYDKWAAFSLKAQLSHVKNAALDFDRLLQRQP